MAAKKIAITLVPGTWPSARWKNRDFPLTRSLKRLLGEDETDVATFEWSGSNDHRERIRAAGDLAEFLAQRAKEAELRQAAHFIVAHSHGGNVALRCLDQSPQKTAHVKGVVLLAVPVLSFTRRDFPKWALWLALAPLRAVLAALASGAIAAVAALAFKSLLPEEALPWVVIAALALSWWFVGRWLLKGVKRSLASKQATLLAESEIALPKSKPVLYQFTPLDEAFWLLKFSERLAILAGRLSYLVPIFLLAGCLYFLGVDPQALNSIRLMTWVVFGPLAFHVLVALMAHVPIRVAMGCDIWQGVFLKASLIHATNLGEHANVEVHRSDQPRSRFKRWRELFHSKIYSDLEVRETMVEWIRKHSLPRGRQEVRPAPSRRARLKPQGPRRKVQGGRRAR